MKTEKLYPAVKNYVWGGKKLSEKYGKTSDVSPLAESWELSFHSDGLTRLSDGRTLAEAAGPDDLGINCARFLRFPMLIKLIDADRDLSVQVHPSDRDVEDGYGKTEMWYVIEAEPGACLYVGFSKPVTKDEVRRAAEDKTLQELLNKIEVRPGDAFLIPAGTVHAIGAGCVICEIQQNSNITYRLYDYGRVGADGKPRELHIEEALAVMKTDAKAVSSPSVSTPDGELLFANGYFTSYRLDVGGGYALPRDGGSFRCLCCVKGSGTLDGADIKAGDSYFVPAGRGAELSGDMTLIVSCVRRYALGIDLGGTFIKGGIVDDLGNIVISEKTETGAEHGADEVALRISRLCSSLLEKTGLDRESVCGIGIGVPGMIDSERGEVIYSNNLKWRHFRITDAVEKNTGLSAVIANDANVAALGEAVFGAGAGCKNTVMLTLGTGVGGGLVLDGRIYAGNASAGAELGHMSIIKDGELCTCGRRGCLEAYASATALIRDTKRMIKDHPDSKMSAETEINGRTAFAYRYTDGYAAKLIDDYIGYLAAGITDIANVFRPEKVIIGGGMSAEGQSLIEPLQKLLDRDIFAGDEGPYVKIEQAALGNRAGILGAAALVLKEEVL